MTDTIPERCLGRVPHLQGFAVFIHCQLPLGNLCTGRSNEVQGKPIDG